MAYFRIRKYIGGGRFRGYRSGRRNWKGRNWQLGGRITRKKSGNSGQTKTILKKLNDLQITEKFGTPEKVIYKVDTNYILYRGGPIYPRQYLKMPVSAVVRNLARASGRSRAFLTGVTLEFDMKHQTVVDVVVFPVAVGNEVGLGTCFINTNNNLIYFGSNK